LEGTFSEGVSELPDLIFLIEKNKYNWDDYRIVMFHYKIACLYFGSGDMNNAITFLNKIILERQPNFREDIQCFARILSLIAHFELGNLQLLEYQVKSVYRFLLKMEDMHEVQKQIIVFIRNIPNIKRENLKNKFIELRDSLLKIKLMPYEKRAFLYLDIIGWLESKIHGKRVEVVLRNQFLKGVKNRESGVENREKS
jgi:tetratricopeptide (TPR) repeat protein